MLLGVHVAITRGGCLLAGVIPALHTCHVVIVLYCFVLKEYCIAVCGDEDRDDEETSEIYCEYKLADLLTVLQHD